MLQLGEIADVYSGTAIKAAPTSGRRFMRLTDLTELGSGGAVRLARGNVPAVARAIPIEDGDLILGARGSTMAACLASREVVGAFVSLDLYLVRPRRAVVCPAYLWSFLRLPATQTFLACAKQGTNLERLPKEALETLVVPVPPLPRQMLVAELALALERERNLLRRMGALKETFELGVLGRAIAGTAAEEIRRHS